MIDVLDFLKKAKRCLLPFHLPGEPILDFCVRARAADPKKWSFWQMACQMVRDSIVHLIRHINRLSESSNLWTQWARDYKVRLSIPFLEGLIAYLNKSIPEVNRWLFEFFVPIPDSEIGGCARSDSAIAPAI